MNILTECERFSPEQLVKIEAHYEATYVCETCLQGVTGDGWINASVSIFYQADPAKVPEGGSQWFGLFFRADHPYEDAPSRLFIVNAISAVEQDIAGIVAKNGDVIYSRYRHDYRWSPDASVMIDGGRDYTRTGRSSSADSGLDLVAFVTLRIVKDKLIIVGDDHE